MCCACFGYTNTQSLWNPQVVSCHIVHMGFTGHPARFKRQAVVTIMLQESLCLYSIACIVCIQVADLCRVTQVCSGLRHLASNNELWKPLFESEFPAVVPSVTAAANQHGYKAAFAAAFKVSWLQVCAHMRMKVRPAYMKHRRYAYKPSAHMCG